MQRISPKIQRSRNVDRGVSGTDTNMRDQNIYGKISTNIRKYKRKNCVAFENSIFYQATMWVEGLNLHIIDNHKLKRVFKNFLYFKSYH